MRCGTWSMRIWYFCVRGRQHHPAMHYQIRFVCTESNAVNRACRGRYCAAQKREERRVDPAQAWLLWERYNGSSALVTAHAGFIGTFRKLLTPANSPAAKKQLCTQASSSSARPAVAAFSSIASVSASWFSGLRFSSLHTWPWAHAFDALQVPT